MNGSSQVPVGTLGCSLKFHDKAYITWLLMICFWVFFSQCLKDSSLWTERMWLRRSERIRAKWKQKLCDHGCPTKRPMGMGGRDVCSWEKDMTTCPLSFPRSLEESPELQPDSLLSEGTQHLLLTAPLMWILPNSFVASCMTYHCECFHPHVDSHWKNILGAWCPVTNTEPSVPSLPPSTSSAPL